MVKDQLIKDLRKAVEDLGYSSDDIVLSIPKNSNFGDYSSNIALQLAKLSPDKDKHSTQEIANEILEKMGKPDYLEKAETAGAGFINFFINGEILVSELEKILKAGKDFGFSKTKNGKKARVEFVSANPTGPLHIGNARSGPLGDVIANVLESSGYEVIREFIDNNVGNQIKALGATIKAKKQGSLVLENQYQGSYIDELVDNLEVDLEKSDEEIGSLAVEKLNVEILADCQKMGIKFDIVVHESELREGAPEILAELDKAGVLKEKDGALWLAPNDEFLKDRETVVKKSDGTYTYFTADIVYHKMKFESGADPIIDIFGSNHHGHIPRLQAAVQALGFDPKRLRVVLYQYVRVKRGDEIVKMSKRAGNFVTAREVLDEVGVDAFRFYLLRFAPETHMDFDLELVKQHTNNNPVYYVQYAHARMSNILNKSSKERGEADYTLLKNPAELVLIKHLLIFPDLISEIAQNLQVHHLTEYAIHLADYFHKFYENCPVLTAENADLVKVRLGLVKAAKLTLANTLKLIGVSAPEKM